MPRNMVAPYEERSDEVRGKGIVIKYLRLEDAKSTHLLASFSRQPDGNFPKNTHKNHIFLLLLREIDYKYEFQSLYISHCFQYKKSFPLNKSRKRKGIVQSTIQPYG